MEPRFEALAAERPQAERVLGLTGRELAALERVQRVRAQAVHAAEAEALLARQRAVRAGPRDGAERERRRGRQADHAPHVAQHAQVAEIPTQLAARALQLEPVVDAGAHRARALREPLEPHEHAVRLAVVDRRVVAPEARAVLVAARVQADRGEIRHAPRHVHAAALALEIVAVIRAREQHRQRILDVIHLLELRVIGTPQHREAEDEPRRGEEGLLHLDAVERALASGGVLEARAEPRVHRARALGLEVDAVAKQVRAVVIDDRLEHLGAPGVVALPGVGVVEQVVAHGRAQPLALGLVLELDRRRDDQRLVPRAVEELDRG